MIALRHGIPLIIDSHGLPANFNKQWIKEALDHAAQQAGHDYCCLGIALTDAIVIYLQQEFKETVIKVSELEEVVQTLLTSLKHDHIADSFFLPDPPIYFSLVDLVLEAGTGYELAFFKLLRTRLEQIAESSSLRLEIGDLQPCLRLLKDRVRLGSHDVLREEIVDYIRCYGRSHSFQKRRQQPLEIELS